MKKPILKEQLYFAKFSQIRPVKLTYQEGVNR